MMVKPDLSVVIVNFNAEKVLRDCLKSLDEQVGLTLEVIVVDNKSKDDSVVMVRREFPRVRCIVRDTEEGFSAANNLGVSYSHADTVLFLNPDTKCHTPHDLKKCYDRLYSMPDVGILTCKLMLASGKIDETCHRGFPTPWASFHHFFGLEKYFPNSPLFAQYLQTFKGYDNEHEVDVVAGAFMMVKGEVGRKMGWWDESYVFYGEDIEFCYRVKELGYKVWYYPKVVITHYKGVSSGMSKHTKKMTTAARKTKIRARMHSISAMEIFYKKHYAKKYPAPLNWFVQSGISLLKFRRRMLL